MKNAFFVLTVFMLSTCTKEPDSTAHADHEEDNERIVLSPSQIKSIGMAYGSVSWRQLSAELQVHGLLDVPPQNLVTVSALMGGFIKSTVLLQGMRVRKGQVIATIQNPDFIQIQQDFLDNSSKLRLAEQEYIRQRELAKNDISSQKVYQQAAEAYQSLKAINGALVERLTLIGISPKQVSKGIIKSTSNILAPIDGHVTVVNINLGKFVQPQDVICEIVNTDHMHVELTVFEKDLTRIRVGQKVRFYLVNEGGQERSAKIYLINKKIGEDRTVRVHAHLDKEDPSLVPNMYLKAQIEVGVNKVVAVPDEAIVAAEGKHYLFVLKGATMKKEASLDPQAFERIQVGIGLSGNGYTEVRLPADFDISTEVVVVKGAYELLSLANMLEGEEHGH